MALVCDVKSDDHQQKQEPLLAPEDASAAATAASTNDDLEDGEIEDDEEDAAPVAEPPVVQEPQNPVPQPPNNASPTSKFVPGDKFSGHNSKGARLDRSDKHGGGGGGGNRYEEGVRKRGHLTEAEKSVMHLHKLERMERLEREKRERFKREQAVAVDDFASNIEKAIANVLRKDKKGSDEEKDEEDKRTKKRKRKDKDKRRTKQRRMGSPKPDQLVDNDLVGSGSPGGGGVAKGGPKERSRSPSSRSDYDSYTSSSESDRSREGRKKKDRGRKDLRAKIRERTRGGNDRKYKDKNRDQKTNAQIKDGQGVCLFYLQGKCNKQSDDCPYSHEAPGPVKLELCKFYLMDCCAKGDKCSYMHSDFPCKFYHTGLPCYAGDNCKFAHGKPLEEHHKQILFKHIETAPKEILGDFPRLNRDGALAMINQAQKLLEIKYGTEKKEAAANNNNEPSVTGAAGKGGSIPPLLELNIPVPTELLPEPKPKEKGEKSTRERSRPSRWQDADAPDSASTVKDQQQQQQPPPLPISFGLKGFYSERGDQDMRVNSNGDIDMRTLPPQLSTLIRNVTQQQPNPELAEHVSKLAQSVLGQDVDIRGKPQDVDIRRSALSVDNQDVDIRRLPRFEGAASNNDNEDMDNGTDEANLQIVTDEDRDEGDHADKRECDVLPANLPKKQRELFLRIRAQQKENVPENQKEAASDEDGNIDWYSDDDDDLRLTIKDDVEEAKSSRSDEESDARASEASLPQAAQIKPVEVMEKLGDLSKIDISAEVTKLLSSINRGGLGAAASSAAAAAPRDPRTLPPDPAAKAASTVPGDPRRARLGSTEGRRQAAEKLSIYEQGSISMEAAGKDVDLRGMDKDTDLRQTFGDTDLRPGSGARLDIDLRHLGLPFKAVQSYTPATEIDASVNSHPAIAWQVHLVDVPRPNYTGLKLSAHDAQNTGDPRLRKIFRLSTEEKDSPASPRQSPRAAGTGATGPPPATGLRADPRRRKMEEKMAAEQAGAAMTYAQQLTVLQTSAFYQSLTSNQKVLLNQELASRSDHTGANDPTLNGVLTNLGLLQGQGQGPGPGPGAVAVAANASALSILANVSNMNPMMGQHQPGPMPMMVPNQNQAFVGQPQPQQQLPPHQPPPQGVNPNVANQMAQSMVQPGLLGAAPGVPNLPPDFQLNFDPRQGGLLGNAPPFNNPNYGTYGGNDEYYDEGNGFGDAPMAVEGRGRGRGGRGGGGGGGFRDRQQQRRGGGRNFNSGGRGSGARNFRNRNRNNRSRTPP